MSVTVQNRLHAAGREADRAIHRPSIDNSRTFCSATSRVMTWKRKWAAALGRFADRSATCLRHKRHARGGFGLRHQVSEFGIGREQFINQAVVLLRIEDLNGQ